MRWTEECFGWLQDELRRINDFGHFNCPISDGRHLFCYRDKKGYKGLRYVRRKAPHGKVRLRDEDYEIDLSAEKDPRQSGFIVATEPLTEGEEWRGLTSGTLNVIKDGAEVFGH